MSGQINTRSKTTKDEGVVYIRLKRGGKRYEVGAWKDKLPAERTEESVKGLYLADVLQMEKVFSNVAKGELYKKDQLLKAFEESPANKGQGKYFKKEEDIIRHIIECGELLVDDATRKESTKQEAGNVKDLAAAVNAKVFKPSDEEEGGKKKAKKGKEKEKVVKWTVEDIERELKNVKFHPKGSGGANVINAIALIKKNGTIPIQRFQTRYSFPVGKGDAAHGEVKELCEANEGNVLLIKSGPSSLEIVIDPEEEGLLGKIREAADDDGKVVPHNLEEGDLTYEAAPAAGSSADAKKKSKKKKDEKKPKGRGDKEEEDDEEEEAPSTAASKKKKGKSKGGAIGADDSKDDGKDLKAMLASLGMDDDDDDGDTGKGKGKKKGKKK